MTGGILATKKRMAARLSVVAGQRSVAAHAKALRSVPSYDGWTRFGNTHNLRAKVLEPWLATGPATGRWARGVLVGE